MCMFVHFIIQSTIPEGVPGCKYQWKGWNIKLIADNPRSD